MNRCPECGREFKPHDPETMRTEHTPGKFVQWLVGPPNWPLHALGIGAGLLQVAANAAPLGYVKLCFVSVLVWMVLLPSWIVLGMSCSSWGWKQRDGTKLDLSNRVRWLIVPACFVVSFGLSMTSIPMRWAFCFSHPSMNSYAQTVIANPATKHGPKWVGLFRAERIEVTRWGMRFIVSGSGFMDRGGFEFVDNESADGRPLGKRIRLGGGWYSWIDDW